MSKRKKDESQETYITEGISFGVFQGVVLSVIIGADVVWAWAVLPGFGMLLGIVVACILRNSSATML